MIAEAGGRALAALPGLRVVSPGEPVAVRAPEGGISYWLVPGLREGRVAALARVLPDGRVATVGEAGGADAAEAATGLSTEGAERASDGAGRGRTLLGGPWLVHDGPVAREAWLWIVGEGETRRRVFATGGGVYERAAGTSPGQ